MRGARAVNDCGARRANAWLPVLVAALVGTSLTLGVLASADPLVPSWSDYRAQRSSVRQHLDDAEAHAQAVGLLQNHFAGFRATAEKLDVCGDPQLESLVARLRAFGPAWRDAVQAARAAWARLEATRRSPGVAPLLDVAERLALADLEGRLQHQARACTEASQWHRRWVETAFVECGPRLRAAPGLPPPGARAPGEESAPVAVIGIGGGLLCPGRLPADGRPVVLPTGRGCVARRTCDCAEAPVEAGAVLEAEPSR